MSGHNKWSKIKHKKAAGDSKKSKEFSKFAQKIALESKKAESNINSPELRAIIDRARAINMPNANIERAIKKGTGENAVNLEEVVYEAYGPGGSAIIIEGLTDNKNRTSAEVKHVLGEHGGNLTERGSATWAFEKKDALWFPKITVQLSEEDKEKLLSLVEKLDAHDDIQNICTNAE